MKNNMQWSFLSYRFQTAQFSRWMPQLNSKFFTFKLSFRLRSAAPKVAEAFKSKLKQLVDSKKHNIILQKLLNPVINTQGTSSQTDGGAEKEGYSGKGPERKVKPRKSAHIC